MKIGILGAGISGLSIAKMLKPFYEVEILEKQAEAGGIARIKNHNGIPYHIVGGHCFNSKNEQVLNYVFNHVLTRENWNLINRKSNIRLGKNTISYPIEYAIKEIESFNSSLAHQIINDLKSTHDDGKYENLEQWFVKKFGQTLSKIYFIPYNQKIWSIHPKEMTVDWIVDKLPNPKKEQILSTLTEKQNDEMVHFQFYYPIKPENNLISSFSENLKISFNYEIKQIEFISSKKYWLINGERKYDLIINTMPLNVLISSLKCPNEIKTAAKKLRYNTITTSIWESEFVDATWTYIPDASSIFHRYIHIGNFLENKRNYSIAECIGKIDHYEIEREGRKDDFLKKLIDVYQSEHAYIVYDHERNESLKMILSHLEEVGLITHGRFGQWDYFNMDVCIEKSILLFEKLTNLKFNEVYE